MSSLEKIKELNQKRVELARYTRNDLEGMTKVRLRELATGVVPGINKATKEDLILGILAATDTERKLSIIIPDISAELKSETSAIAASVDDVADTILGSYAEQIYKTFRKLVIQRWDGEKGVWKEDICVELSSVGYRITSYLDNLTNREGKRIAPTTALRYRTKILNALTAMVDQEKGAVFYTQLSSSLELVKKACRVQMRDKAEVKYDAQEKKLAARQKLIEDICFTPILEFVHDTLNKINELPASKWTQVSIALAIATGRRSSELHSTASFAKAGANEVVFSGQLKARGDAAQWYKENPSYTIPTLVPADMILDGMAWLERNNKRVDDPEKAHKRYSKDLSSALKIVKQRIGVDTERLTYHKLRVLYAQVCKQCFKPSKQNEIQFLADILGHGRGDEEAGLTGKFSDNLTPQSYNSDFEVTEASYIPG